MIDTQESSTDFNQLYIELKKYVELQTEYVKVEFVEKLTIFLSTLIIIAIVLVLVMGLLFYLLFSLAYTLEPILGSLALSFGAISGVYLLLIIIFVVLRKQMVINPLVKFLTKLFLTNNK